MTFINRVSFFATLWKVTKWVARNIWQNVNIFSLFIPLHMPRACGEQIFLYYS